MSSTTHAAPPSEVVVETVSHTICIRETGGESVRVWLEDRPDGPSVEIRRQPYGLWLVAPVDAAIDPKLMVQAEADMSKSAHKLFHTHLELASGSLETNWDSACLCTVRRLDLAVHVMAI